MARDIQRTERCPLCNALNTTVQEILQGSEINALYLRKYGLSNAIAAETLEFRSCPKCGLGFFSPPETGNEAIYERLYSGGVRYRDNKEEFRIARRFLSDRGSVLDVGAGIGGFAAMVGRERYTGLEFNDVAIEQASRAGIVLLKESIEEHAAKGDRYDAVVAFQVLEHVASPAAFIERCLECVEPGGVFVIGVPSQDGICGRAINHALDMPPHHVTRWSAVTLLRIADLFGLECVGVEHEPVVSRHSRWARKTLIEMAIRRRFDMPMRVMDRSRRSRLISNFSAALSLAVRFPMDESKGHTIVAAYRKPRSARD